MSKGIITYSRKVFLPLTHLCRDVCHYCTFARPASAVASPYMSVDEVLEAARAAEAVGCQEALLTLGERPELRWAAARAALDELGFESTIDYVAHVAARLLAETTLLPHVNAGTLSADELRRLRPVSASMGMMLESTAPQLSERGGPHHGSPDKAPAARLETIRWAGELKVAFTTGLLIGIGETRDDRVRDLETLKALHDRHGHLQELILQSFRAKAGTRMAAAPEPGLDELLWTVRTAREIFGSDMAIQVPPNLTPDGLRQLIEAGVDDWGGIGPVTPDYVNPEAPWPEISALAGKTAAAGKALHERLTLYPRYALAADRWLDPALRKRVRAMIDADGLARVDGWISGSSKHLPAPVATPPTELRAELVDIVHRAEEGEPLTEAEVATLFSARDGDAAFVQRRADLLRQKTVGATVTYVVNRNINYTNICNYGCRFCAFSKGRRSDALRERPYDLDAEEIGRRVAEGWERGATEVCLQGGIHPRYDGKTYLRILDIVKAAAPDIHIHAFSPLEVLHGATASGMTVRNYLRELKAAGLGSLPGTAAEILDDAVRQILCPQKLSTAQWLEVVGTAHEIGLPTTATIMFGHVDGSLHWARHLLRIREQQRRTGGFTEFVPLPFVADGAPIYLSGQARRGPTFREAVLMHAVARLTLNRWIPNIQTSWVKMGEAGAAACLDAGANDFGGTLMNESITRAAGASHGQELPVDRIVALIRGRRREPRQRTTLYGEPASAPGGLKRAMAG